MTIRYYNTQDVETFRYWMFGETGNKSFKFVDKAIVRAPKEVGCAFFASCLVSPIVSIIDKCIVQDISGTSQFLRAVGIASKEMLVSPKAFFGGLSFRFTWFVYFGTFATANLSELALDCNRIRKDDDRKKAKVAASGVANISLLAWRDSVFAREFGGAKVPPSTPFRTIGLFATRDMATMYATFYTAPAVAVYLRREHGVERNTAELGCALGIPAFFQVITAPLHIHAMDYYNNRSPSVTWSDRWATIQKEFRTVSFARSVRILPAFGIGSFSNNKLRELFIRQENENLLLSRRVTVMVEPVRRRLTQNW